MNISERLLLLAGLSSCTALAATLTAGQVKNLPIFYHYQERPVRQTVTAAERTANVALLKKLQGQKPLQAYIKRNLPNFDGFQSGDVIMTLKAPYRSPEPETLTIVNLYEGEPPIQLFHLSGNRYAREAAWVTEPKGNFNICGLHEAYTTRDVNLDGLREVALIVGCGDGPWWGLDLYSYAWVRGELQLFGWFNVVSAGPGETEKTEESIHELHVQKGATPVLYSLVTTRTVDYPAEGKTQVFKQSTSVKQLPWRTSERDEDGKPYQPYAAVRLW